MTTSLGTDIRYPVGSFAGAIHGGTTREGPGQRRRAGDRGWSASGWPDALLGRARRAPGAGGSAGRSIVRGSVGVALGAGAEHLRVPVLVRAGGILLPRPGVELIERRDAIAVGLGDEIERFAEQLGWGAVVLVPG